MKKSLFTAIITVLVFTTRVFATEFPFKFPEKGKAVIITDGGYKMENWKSKSVGAYPWFVFTGERDYWYLDWDAERQPLKSLVIHHSGTSFSATADSLSRSGLYRLYEPVYNLKNYQTPYVFGLPPHSGHVINGKETFIAYHHLVFEDGRVETTLVPFLKIDDVYYVDMIGWGAGNWKINCQSVQICLVGDYSEIIPSDKVIASLNKLVEAYRDLVPEIEIIPHKEVRPRPTVCPGAWFNRWQAKYAKRR